MFQTRQSGAALVVVMVIMLIITIMGVSGMKMGLFQQQASTNQQLAYTAFNAAESALDSLINEYTAGDVIFPNITNDKHAYCATATGDVAQDAACSGASLDGASKVTGEATVEYFSCGECANFTRNIGSTRGAKCHIYKLEGEGQVTDQANTTLEQWTYAEGPCL